MRQRTTPGHLCRIHAPKPEDEKPRRAYETGPDGMVKDIDEPISVLTRFSKGQIDPLRFKWNKRIYDEYGRKHRSLHSDGPHHQHFETYANILHLNHVDIGGWSRLEPAVEILKPARCVVHGGLNNRDLYDGWTETLRQKIRQRIRLAAPGGGYIFAIGGETYAGTDPEVLCRTFEYAHEVGKYPIEIPDEEWLEEEDRPWSLAEAKAG